MEAVFLSPPNSTPPLFGALYCSQGLQSEPEEKVDFLRGANNPPVPSGLLVVCRSTARQNPFPFTEQEQPECIGNCLYAVTLPPVYCDTAVNNQSP